MFALAFLLGLASTVFFVWLVVIAFRQGALWGLVALFVPFGNVVFAVKHWAESKKPFLSGLACSVLSIALLFGGFALGAAGMTRQMMNDPEFQQALRDMQLEGNVEPDGTAEVATAVPAIETDPGRREEMTDPAAVTRLALDAGEQHTPAPLQPAQASPRDQIRIRQAADHVGSTMRVIGSRMDTVARLVSVEGGKLQFEQELGGGSIVFEMRDAEIESLELVR